MARPQQYDVFRPGALPSASLGRRPLGGGPGGPDLTGTADKTHASELDKVYDDWNTRIDKEVAAVAGGLRELVALADIGEMPTPNTHTLTALHLKLKTSALIRAAQTLRDTAHELRLALALGDDIASSGRRDNETVAARREVETLRAQVAREFGGLVAKVPPGSEGNAALDVGGGVGAGTRAAGGEGAAAAASSGAAGEKRTGAGAGAPAHSAAAEDDGMDVDDDEEDEFEEV